MLLLFVGWGGMPGMPGMLGVGGVGGVGLNRSMHELNKESLELNFEEREKIVAAKLSGSKGREGVQLSLRSSTIIFGPLFYISFNITYLDQHHKKTFSVC